MLMLLLQVSNLTSHVGCFLIIELFFYLALATFAKSFKETGMHGYVSNVQRKERENGVDVLQHQKWSGANYVDELMKVVTGGVAATAAMGAGVTEDQFK